MRAPLNERKRIAVLGLFRSGSTAVAGALHHLGVDMGAPFFLRYYESEWLSEQLRIWWNQPDLEEKVSAAERVRVLKQWIEERERTGASCVGMKHPLLSLCGEDLLKAWGPNTQLIRCYRPLEESIASLKSLEWSAGKSEFMQQILWDELNRFLSGRAHLQVTFSTLMADPPGEILRLIEFLQLEPESEQIAAAIKFIEPGKKAKVEQELKRIRTPKPEKSRTLPRRITAAEVGGRIKARVTQHARRKRRNTGEGIYQPEFYAQQASVAAGSAALVLPEVFKIIGVPSSIVDVGCGVGAWGRVAQQLGTVRYVGIDGKYVPLDQLLISREMFIATDLEKVDAIVLPDKFDLAVSLEVAEHLTKGSEEKLIRFLTSHSDRVLFSSAVPGQGGTNHFNEQWQSHWAKIFERLGFDAFDIVRANIAGKKDIKYWYRQNIVLYVKQGCPTLASDGSVSKPTKAEALDLVVPDLYQEKLRELEQLTLRKLLKRIPAALKYEFERRLGLRRVEDEG